MTRSVPLSHDFPTASSFNCPLILKDPLDLSGSESHERIESIATIAQCAIYSQEFYAWRNRTLPGRLKSTGSSSDRGIGSTGAAQGDLETITCQHPADRRP